MPDAGIPGSDYINASYVSVSRKSLTFLVYLFFWQTRESKNNLQEEQDSDFTFIHYSYCCHGIVQVTPVALNMTS